LAVCDTGGVRRIAALLILAGLALAQELPWDAEQLDPEALRQALADARTRLGQLGEPATDELKLAREAASMRVQMLEQLLQTLEERGGLMGVDEIDRRKTAATAALAEVKGKKPDPVAARVPADLAPLEQAFREAEAEHSAKKGAFEQLVARRKAGDEELRLLPEREADVKRRLERARENGTTPLAVYQIANRRLELRLLQERGQFLREALDRWALRIPMQQAELSVAEARMQSAQERLAAARDSVARVLKDQAETDKARAESAAKRAENETDPIARFRRRVQAEIGTHRAETKQEQAALADLDQRLDAEKAAGARLAEELRRLEERLDAREGIQERTARLLQKTLARTDRRRATLRRRALPKLDSKMAEYLGKLGDVQDRRWELDEPVEDLEDWQTLRAEVDHARTDEARKALADALYGEEGLETALRERQAVLEEVYARLGQIETLYGDQLRSLDKISGFVTVRIFWVRSDPPISWAAFGELGGELARLAALFEERDALRPFRSRPVSSTSLALAAFGVLFAAFFLFRRVRSYRRAVEAKASSPGQITLHTLVALLLSACVPLALLVAWVLFSLIDFPDVIERPVARVVPLLALFLFVRAFAARLLGPDRIAVADFGLPRAVAVQLLRSVNVATFGGILFFLPYVALTSLDAPFPWLSRLLFTAVEVTDVLAILLLLPRRGALVKAWTGGQGTLYRAWAVVGPLLSLGLLGILVMDVLGYRFGSRRLLWSAGETIVAILVLIGLYRLLRAVVEKVAYEVRRRTAKEEGFQAAWESSRTVLSQLTRVLSVLVIAAAMFLLASFWGIDSSIRSLLDGIHLAELEGDQYLSLWDAVIALLWVAGGHFLVHNLSGIYQFLVLPLIGTAERGGQFVFVALSRYVILIIAYSVALLTLHFSFSSIGWLLAAASVGLGFGLQEIVANFISGLILLVERPIRVGDIITVGDSGGTVEKINIRATTVTNWDRQQIIIPNKSFITENLTNWTRNDEIMRGKVAVGVSYGSDATKVLQVLHDIVEHNEKILKEPPARIWFMGFGDSSLNFEVWFFSTVDDRFPVMTDLRARIHARFAEEGIEIPFPQRDLHLKSIDDPESLAALLERRRKESVD